MTQTQTMRAITIDGGKGPASSLRMDTAPMPAVNDGQILIRIRAAGVNRPDLMQREGLYPPPPGASATLGLEVAGEVVRPAGRFKEGDRVCALLSGGGYAEFAVCDARHALPIPDGLSFEEAAGLPETVFTVFTNVFEDGHLKSGETFMVHGGTSGIGSTAIQMAKAAGARVISTSRSAAKAAAASRLGADVSVDTSTESFAEVAKREGGVDVILEMVGGSAFASDLEVLKPHGRIVFIAAQAGWDVSLPIFPMMQKRVVITGSTLRARSADEKARLTEAVERVVWPWVESGKLRAPVDRTFELKDAALAHAHLESGSHVGKVVLSVAHAGTPAV